MKVSSALFLILVTVIIQLCSSNFVSNNKEIITENGTDVVLTEPGPLDVIVGDELVFEFCTEKCFAEYEIFNMLIIIYVHTKIIHF